MKAFPYGHATHPQWQMAAGLVLAQLRAQMALAQYAAKPRLGLVYLTDHYASEAQAVLDHLREQLPAVQDWAGTVGVGIAANNVEYFDEPALAVMLCDLPAASYRVFSGLAPLASSASNAAVGNSFQAHTALVHADGHTPDLPELLAELADRTASGYLFGGLASSRHEVPQMAWPSHARAQRSADAHGGVLEGGLSGVAFAQDVALVSRVTQGCEPISLPDKKKAVAHRITKSDGHVVIELDDEPALDVLLDELGISLNEPQHAMLRLRETLVGLSADADAENMADGTTSSRERGSFGVDTRVRHLIGLDPLRRGIAVADMAPQGSLLTFCHRDKQAARRDLMRICAEIREELEPVELSTSNATNSVAASAYSTGAAGHFSSKNILGAVYVSCAGRGGPHFGGDSAELQIVRHALGDVPLVGFFAGGEIAHRQLYGYTGVLTVFTD